MDADYDIFEIVAVIRDFWLVDAESYQRRYCTNNGQPFAPGYYVVFWPEHIRARRFDEHAAFHGPFKLRKEAQAIQDWMHKERTRLLTMPFRISSVAAPDSSATEVKKVASQKPRPTEGAKASQTVFGRKPRITGLPPPDYRKTVKVAVR
jgi:hypothetical protein